MVDKAVWVMRWVVAGVVGGVLALWPVAVVFALAGFRETAEAINDLFLNTLPFAAVLLAMLIVAMLARWLFGPGAMRL
jgi:hypothetical protein